MLDDVGDDFPILFWDRGEHEIESLHGRYLEIINGRHSQQYIIWDLLDLPQIVVSRVHHGG
jgi:hypothetical protein